MLQKFMFVLFIIVAHIKKNKIIKIGHTPTPPPPIFFENLTILFENLSKSKLIDKDSNIVSRNQ